MQIFSERTTAMTVYAFIINMNTTTTQHGEQQFSSGLYCRTQKSV